MNIAQFWELIERTRMLSNGDVVLQADLLIQELSVLSIDEITAYGQIFDTFYVRAYRHDIIDVADLIYGGLGDSGIKDFLAWLISQGKNTYENTITNPEFLVDIVSFDRRENITAEKLGYAADLAYQKKTDSEDFLPYIPPEESGSMGENRLGGLAGQEFEQRAKELYPKTWAKFGW